MGLIRNIIFDFDGTLADTSQLIVETMQKSIKDLGLPFRNEEQIKATIGMRLEEIPSILWPSIKEIGQSFAAVYRMTFESLKDKIPVTLFPGVKGTLTGLKEEGYLMAIATSRSHRSVEELTEQLGIRECFAILLGGNDVSAGKPNPESIYKILSLQDWEPEKSIMVGDMAVDIMMGRNAGIKTCGVTFGNGKAVELEEAGADFIISEFSALPGILAC